VVECDGLYQNIQEGDSIEIDPSTGIIRIQGKALEFTGSKLPDFLLGIIKDGGLIPHLILEN
jgi:3-isopropylmalate/(R)-2-methylmalate dehydratase small subunit